jgi:hypothetical protein
LRTEIFFWSYFGFHTCASSQFGVDFLRCLLCCAICPQGFLALLLRSIFRSFRRVPYSRFHCAASRSSCRSKIFRSASSSFPSAQLCPALSFPRSTRHRAAPGLGLAPVGVRAWCAPVSSKFHSSSISFCSSFLSLASVLPLTLSNLFYPTVSPLDFCCCLFLRECRAHWFVSAATNVSCFGPAGAVSDFAACVFGHHFQESAPSACCLDRFQLQVRT